MQVVENIQNVMKLFLLKTLQNTTEDTEWNDVLRRKGILPPKPSEAEITEEEIENMVECVVKTYTSSMLIFKLRLDLQAYIIFNVV